MHLHLYEILVGLVGIEPNDQPIMSRTLLTNKLQAQYGTSCRIRTHINRTRNTMSYPLDEWRKNIIYEVSCELIRTPLKTHFSIKSYLDVLPLM